MSILRQSIEKVLEKGTRIMSFDYDGKRRNVLVGSTHIELGSPIWGEQVNRAIRTHKGKEFLIAECNNEGANRPIKAFELSKISAPSIL